MALEVELLGCGVVQRVVEYVGQPPQQSGVIWTSSELFSIPVDVKGFVFDVDEVQ